MIKHVFIRKNFPTFEDATKSEGLPCKVVNSITEDVQAADACSDSESRRWTICPLTYLLNLRLYD
jgi:hypothetical protein